MSRRELSTIGQQDKQAYMFSGATSDSASSECLSSTPEIQAVVVLLQRRGWAFLNVVGKSMFPWIRPRDLLFLRRAALAEIERGEVIVFARNGVLCVHRVLLAVADTQGREVTPALIAKGDAVADRDEPVTAAELLGKVEFVYRRNREIRISTGWRRYFGKLLAFVSPLTPYGRPVITKLNRMITGSEVLPMLRVEADRPPEHSAD